MVRKEGAMAKIASKLDAFAKPPTMYYRGQSSLSTTAGCFCTVVIFITLVAFFIQDLQMYPDL
jgi:hypothetical protein